MSEVVSPRGPCRFCLNARSDPSGYLTDDNDLSYCHIGSVDAEYDHACMHLRSGDHRPVAVVVSVWHRLFNQRVDVAVYLPKFCPECGRPLIDDYPEKRGMYDEEETE